MVVEEVDVEAGEVESADSAAAVVVRDARRSGRKGARGTEDVRLVFV